MTYKSRRWWLWAVVALGVAAGGAWMWKKTLPDGSGTAPVPATAASSAAAQTVSVVPAVLRDLPVFLEAAGTVVALNSVEIRPQVSSTVQEIHLREGQTVTRGQVLFTLDDRNERANLDKARAQVVRDRASLADVERQWRRAQELLAQNFVSGSAVDTARAQVDVQRAALQADEAAVKASEVALTYTTVRSPLTGQAGAITVRPGSLVQPSGAALVVVSQMDPIGVSFNLPEAELSGLLAERGSAVPLSVRLPGTPRGAGAASAVAPSASTWDGVLSFIDNTVDATTGTVKVKGTFANARQTLWPGQYVQVRLTLRTLPNAVVVPQAALIQRGLEHLVYAVDADGRAQSRTVKVRQTLGESVAVEGLSAGESVVVEGKQNLRPGTPLRIEGRAPSAAAASR